MPPLRSAVDHIRRIVRPRPLRDTDRALLTAFALKRDEAAFAELVRRHGALVRGVCRRVLANESAADDAFQATFLLLARKAGSGGWHDSISGWLHAAAWHTAQKAGRAAQRRSRFAASADLAALPHTHSTDPLAAAAWSELCQVLDEELARLPERLRAPLVLCYLEGRTRDEAAARLGWPLGTLKHRLARARALLRNRLTRRGISPTFAGLPAAVTGEALSAATAVDVARLAAGYICGEAVAGPVAALLGGTSWSAGAKAALVTSLVLLASIGAGVASRERERPEDAPKEKTPVAHAPGSPRLLADPLPKGAIARLGTLAFCHGQPVQQILTSPDGKSIITIGGPVRIWDAATGREQGAIAPPEKQFFMSGALLPGGEQLALSCFDGSIRIWDWKTRGEVRSIKPELEGKVIGLGSYVFDPTGRLAVLTNHNGNAPVVDLATGKVKIELPCKPSYALMAAFTADGKTVISAESGGPLQFWDMATGKQQRQIASPMLNADVLAASPDSRWLAVAGRSMQTFPAPGRGTINISMADKNVHIVDLTAGRDVYQVDSGASGNETPNPSLLITPDSRFLITGANSTNGQFVRQWDLATGKQVREFVAPGSGAMGGGTPALALSRDGRTLLTADTVVHRCNLQTGKEKSKPGDNPGAAKTLAFLPDGHSLIVGGDGLSVWDTTTSRQLRRLGGGDRLAVSPARVDVIAVPPDGRTLAVVIQDGELCRLAVIDTATGRHLRETKIGAGVLAGLAVSPDGESVATATASPKLSNGTVRIWDYATLSERRVVKLRFPGGWLSFSRDGRAIHGLMIAYGKRQFLFSIDPETGKLTEHAGQGSDTQFLAYSWSPDGQVLAMAGWRGNLSSLANHTDQARICIFDAATGKPVREFTGVRFVPFQIAYSPDGKWLAAGDWNALVSIWDVATGKQVRDFTGHRGQIRSLAFSTDGKRLASGSIDTTVLIWDLSDMHPAAK